MPCSGKKLTFSGLGCGYLHPLKIETLGTPLTLWLVGHTTDQCAARPDSRQLCRTTTYEVYQSNLATWKGNSA